MGRGGIAIIGVNCEGCKLALNDYSVKARRKQTVDHESEVLLQLQCTCLRSDIKANPLKYIHLCFHEAFSKY